MNPDLMQPKYRALFEQAYHAYYGSRTEKSAHSEELANAYAANAVWSAAIADIVAARVYEIVPVRAAGHSPATAHRV